MAKAKILVTGGTGYIGSHTTVELIKEGFDVVIVDNLSNSSIDMLNGIEQITGVRPVFEKFDLCDQEKVKVFFKKHADISAIIHFAAYKAVGESVQKPLMYYHNNLVSLLNLLEIIQEKPSVKMVFSSSCTVYGQPDGLPVTEDAPIKKANSPYGNTKQISEEIIQDTILANPSVSAIALRYFNPIGAHESGLIGELPIGVPQNLVPFITQTALGIRESLSVFGNDYNTKDGSCIRDYIHVFDIANAHVLALMKMDDLQVGIYNMGNNSGYSNQQVIKATERVIGKKIPWVPAPRRPGDPARLVASSDCIRQNLGWAPRYPELETMVETAWTWRMKHPKGYAD